LDRRDHSPVLAFRKEANLLLGGGVAQDIQIAPLHPIDDGASLVDQRQDGSILAGHDLGLDVVTGASAIDFRVESGNHRASTGERV
jgi:hypothetical protein